MQLIKCPIEGNKVYQLQFTEEEITKLANCIYDVDAILYDNDDLVDDIRYVHKISNLSETLIGFVDRELPPRPVMFDEI